MKKTVSPMIIFAMVALLPFIQGYKLKPDVVVRKELDLLPFEKVYVNSDFNVYLTQGKEQKVKVEILKEIFDQSEFMVEDNILHLNLKKPDEPKSKSIWDKIDDIKVNPEREIYITVPNLTALKVNGSGMVRTVNSFNASSFELLVSADGEAEVDLKTEKIDVNLTGDGNLKLSGYGDSATMTVSGDGELDAFAFDLTTADVKVYGAGLIQVNTSKTLNAKLYGPGKIEYRGDQVNATTRSYGSGEIIRVYK